MPRLTGTKVPAYRHFKARNLACVDIDGQRFYLGPWNSKDSLIEYDRLIAEWLACGRRISAQQHDNRISIAEVILAFVEFANRYYRKNGQLTDEARLIADAMRIVKRLYGQLPAVEFGPIAYKAARQEMIKAGWSRKHINKQCDRVKRMFRWAAEEELVPGSVYETLGCVRGLKAGLCEAKESDPVEPVPENVFQTTLTHHPQTVCDMARLQRLIGARPTEVCLIRRCDIDRERAVWLYRPESHKTEHHGKQRIVFVGPKAQAILRPYLLRSADAHCFSPTDSERQRRTELLRHFILCIPLFLGHWQRPIKYHLK